MVDSEPMCITDIINGGDDYPYPPDTMVVQRAQACGGVAGVPVALLGLFFFAALALLCLPAAWRSRRPLLRSLRLSAASAGVLLVLYLIWAELFRINAICLWCTAIHILTIALFTIVTIAHALNGPPRNHQP